MKGGYGVEYSVGLMWRVKGEVLCEEVEYGVEG